MSVNHWYRSDALTETNCLCLMFNCQIKGIFYSKIKDDILAGTTATAGGSDCVICSRLECRRRTLDRVFSIMMVGQGQTCGQGRTYRKDGIAVLNRHCCNGIAQTDSLCKLSSLKFHRVVHRQLKCDSLADTAADAGSGDGIISSRLEVYRCTLDGILASSMSRQLESCRQYR